MNKEELINKIWDCYIDIHNSCGMITDEEAMQKSIKLLDEYELSKLHQPTVISAVCEHEWKADTFDCYGNAISMYCDECGAKQIDL